MQSKPRGCNYWITVQWPYRVDQAATTPRSEVYLPDGLESVGAELNPGDLVAVYETKYGRPIVSKGPSGDRVITHHRPGQQGVVALLKIKTIFRANKKSTPEYYLNGTKILWKWYADAQQYSHSGFVSRQKLNHILNYKSNYLYRGFGDRKSGLKKITKEQFIKISSFF